MTLREAIILLVLTAGVIFLLFSAIGIARMRDVMQRMHAGGIGSTLAIVLLLVSVGISHSTPAIWLRIVLLIVLFFATSPIATTAMARAAWRKLPAPTRANLTFDAMTDAAEGPEWTLSYQELFPDDEAQ